MKLHRFNGNIVLCGLPGVGKTSVGRLLARKLERQFIDTDDKIEEQVGMSCREYYLQAGQLAFREVESKAILELVGYQDHVIALGGGCVESGQVLANMKSLGPVIHLCHDIEFLVRRKVYRDKPAYAKGRDDYRKLATERLPLFQSVSDIAINLRDMTIPGAVQLIIEELERIYGQ